MEGWDAGECASARCSQHLSLANEAALADARFTAPPELKLFIPAAPGGGWDGTGRTVEKVLSSSSAWWGEQIDDAPPTKNSGQPGAPVLGAAVLCDIGSGVAHPPRIAHSASYLFDKAAKADRELSADRAGKAGSPFCA
jgi:hypothetical protein